MLLYFLCMYNHHTPCLSFLADSRNHRKVFPVLLALRNLIVNFDIHTAEVFPNDFPYFRTRNVSFQTWKPLGHDNDRTSNVLVFSICFRIIYSYLSTNYASEHLTWKYTVLCSSLGDNWNATPNHVFRYVWSRERSISVVTEWSYLRKG